ncbi:MAG: hypothetical protein MGF17_07690 [Trichodesmium sp. MAG_R04]|nr:hypothetical protein [Trichodesmium sp. MAG_R04]
MQEFAALKGQILEEISQEMMEAIRKYLEAINTEIKLKYNMPIDINKYVDNIEKLANVIECFWNIFSVENRHYLINKVNSKNYVVQASCSRRRTL